MQNDLFERWCDITVYDNDKTKPCKWKLEGVPLKVFLYRKPSLVDHWFLMCVDVGIQDYQLKAMDVETAKLEAEEVLEVTLLRLMDRYITALGQIGKREVYPEETDYEYPVNVGDLVRHVKDTTYLGIVTHLDRNRPHPTTCNVLWVGCDEIDTQWTNKLVKCEPENKIGGLTNKKPWSNLEILTKELDRRERNTNTLIWEEIQYGLDMITSAALVTAGSGDPGQSVVNRFFRALGRQLASRLADLQKLEVGGYYG